MSAFNPVKNSSIVTKLLFSTTVGFTGIYWSLKYLAKYHPETAHSLVWSKWSRLLYGPSNPQKEEDSSSVRVFKSLAHEYPEVMQFLARNILYHDLFPKVNIDTQGVDLSVKYGEYTFENPLGNAAGVDKQAKMIDGLSNLGFGFVEIGELSPEFEGYYDKPEYAKVFMKLYPQESLALWKDVYSNHGLQHALAKLVQRQSRIVKNPSLLNHSKITGINICPSRSTIDTVPFLLKMDYETGVDKIVDFTDYIVINLWEKDKSKRLAISSLRSKEELTKLIHTVKDKIAINLGKIAAYEYAKLEKASSKEPETIIDIPDQIRNVVFRNSIISKNNVPMIFLKIDSYLTEQEYEVISQVALKEKIDGLVIGSTIPINVGIKHKDKRKLSHDAALGGAGGKPTQEFAEYALKTVYKQTQGKLLLISNGGIFTGKDMYDRISNGADMVQIYSALAFRGPYIAKTILEEFSDLWKQNDETPRSLVGKNLKL